MLQGLKRDGVLLEWAQDGTDRKWRAWVSGADEIIMGFAGMWNRGNAIRSAMAQAKDRGVDPRTLDNLLAAYRSECEVLA